jgi:N-acetylglucosaminyl-diphospho-decaprenol L-rhamnosyltransferase
MTRLDCTIIILSYNSLAVTDTCLAKVRSAIRQSSRVLENHIKVIVVDNGSVDGSPRMIRQKYPWVKLIALKTNIGYAAGNNLAMKMADTPYLLLMNSDTYIETDSITKALNRIIRAPHCDIVVGRCVYANGVLQKYGGFLPTPLRIILWSFGFESLPLLKKYLPKIYGFEDNYYTREGFMEWCPPCFFLLKAEVYKSTSGFDEHLWFHMVDAEWCHRIHQRGFRICFTPNIQVVHLGGASSKGLEYNLVKDNFKGLIHFCRIHYPGSLHLVLLFLKIGLTMRRYFYFLAGNKNLSGLYQSIVAEYLIAD